MLPFLIIAPSDYNGGTFNCTIPAGMTKVTCVSLPTKLNLPMENNEVFKATLSLPFGPDYAQVGPDPATVTIIDRTGKNAVVIVYRIWRSL